MFQNKYSVVIELKVTCYRKVGLNILVSIEHLSHVNNVPLLFTNTPKLKQGQGKDCFKEYLKP